MFFDSILPVIVGGMLALAGTLVGPFFQRRQERLKAQREDRALLRDKAQEIFDEIDRVVSHSRGASIDALQRALPNPENPATPISAVADLGRLRGLVATYYPSGLQYIEAFEHNTGLLLQNVEEQMKALLKVGGEDVDNIAKLPAIMAVSHQKIVTIFATELREHITQKVKEHSPVG